MRLENMPYSANVEFQHAVMILHRPYVKFEQYSIEPPSGFEEPYTPDNTGFLIAAGLFGMWLALMFVLVALFVSTKEK